MRTATCSASARRCTTLDLRGTPSSGEVIARARAERAKTGPRGPWIRRVRGWDQNDWPVKAWPLAHGARRAAPGRRCGSTRIDGHAGVGQPPGAEAAGHHAPAPDPPAGALSATPRARRRASWSTRAMDARRARRHRRRRRGDRGARFCAADRAMLQRLGLTMVHDAGVAERVAVALYRRLVAARPPEDARST